LLIISSAYFELFRRYRLSSNKDRFAWNLCSNLSLPLPLPLPVVGLFLPIISIICVCSTVFFRDKGYNLFKSLPVITVYVTAITLVVFFTLSFLYFAPILFRSFSLESKWDQLFRSKDENAVQLIQAQLKCCGLNNTHDRAWPFPEKNIDAYECERSQGWERPCLGVWRKNLIIASTLSWVSNIAGLISVVGMHRTYC
jgi:hypothetical protein